MQGFMQNFFWITGGLFIAGIGLLGGVLGVIFFRCAIEARRESRKEKAIGAARLILVRELAGFRRWFTEWPEIDGLLDLMTTRFMVTGQLDGGRVREDWLKVLKEIGEKREAKTENCWEQLLKKPKQVDRSSGYSEFVEKTLAEVESNLQPAEAATDEPITALTEGAFTRGGFNDCSNPTTRPAPPQGSGTKHLAPLPGERL
jgi:hypothetical protein